MDRERGKGKVERKGGEESLGIVGREKTLKIIEQDIPRTFANLSLFKKGGPLYKDLKDIL
jgi:hypothetical protein